MIEKINQKGYSPLDRISIMEDAINEIIDVLNKLEENDGKFHLDEIKMPEPTVQKVPFMVDLPKIDKIEPLKPEELPFPKKCSCDGCDNEATHSWSGHPTCDECATPSRSNNTLEKSVICPDCNKEISISKAYTGGGDKTARCKSCTIIKITKKYHNADLSKTIGERK